MVHQSRQVDCFKQQLQEMFRKETAHSRVVKVPRHDHIYTCGDRDAMIYCIESGHVKEVLLSPEGKECLLAIYTPGDIFGELCLYGHRARLDTTVAREETLLRKMPAGTFLKALSREGMLEGMVQYLTTRIFDQHQVIRTMVTVNCEQRLAITLLRLAKRLGKGDPLNLRIAQRISHEELAEMVGTTRPRICTFLQKFRRLGLIELTRQRHFIIREKGMKEYLAGTAIPQETTTPSRGSQIAALKPDGLTSLFPGTTVQPENRLLELASGEDFPS